MLLVAHGVRRRLLSLSAAAAEHRLVSSHSVCHCAARASRSSSSQAARVSATSIFYRKLVPSMLHCLALGSIACYALELLHSHLYGQYIAKELQTRVDGLKSELEQLHRSGHGEISSMELLVTHVHPPDPQRHRHWWQVG
ncbi:BQ2448_2328 [Microbotryum intermedium]|uniref:BQ2448_2328 protein n=1 Tax=Microbotryum intermedium TaxID=269621 RepID=A0A238FDU3_9BASI|nr:BQ2448_2328 [Microbotryum intermedium]